MVAPYENYTRLLFERRGYVLTVTFNRPDARNATDLAMHSEITTVFRDIAKDDETRVVVLTGAGKTFSAGGDVNNMLRRLADESLWQDGMREAYEIVMSMIELDKPIIARVNGHAMGLGATLALFADIAIAAEDAKITDSHVKIGLCAGDGGAVIWPFLVSLSRAKEYLLTGEPITGKLAAEIGLINHAVPLEELDGKVYALADKLAAGAPKAIQATKRALNMQLRAYAETALKAQLGLETETHRTEDHRNAAQAFLEKRPPVFTGR